MSYNKGPRKPVKEWRRVSEEGGESLSSQGNRRGGLPPSDALLTAIRNRNVKETCWELLEDHVLTNKGERSYARDAASILGQIIKIEHNIEPKEELTKEEQEELDAFINEEALKRKG